MKLKLEAVSTVKLLPVIGVVSPELPGPVEVFHISHLGNYLINELLDIKGLIDVKLNSIRVCINQIMFKKGRFSGKIYIRKVDVRIHSYLIYFLPNSDGSRLKIKVGQVVENSCHDKVN